MTKRLRNGLAAFILVSPLSAQTTANETWQHLPLSFEANQGQADTQVKFLAQGPGYILFLTPTENIIQTGKAAVHVALIGANPQAELSGAEERPGRSNYLIGNDRARWHTNVPQYARVRYRNIYPGVDLVYYGNPQDLEYDFVVAPEARPQAIEFAVSGGKLRLSASGDLLIETGVGEMRLRQPTIYQERGGQRRKIAGGYVLGHNAHVRFRVGQYDRKEPLVIDPTFLVSRYLGGSGADYINGLAVDASGNSYLTGQTDSASFPTTSGSAKTAFAGGSADAFVTKLSPSGDVIYSTFLGGKDYDGGAAVAVGPDGSVYVAGTTASSDFPAVDAAQSSFKGVDDGFVVKLNPSGSALVYSTWIGGSGPDFASAIALASDGSAWIVGSTSSADFPTVSPFQATLKGKSNAFVARYNPAGVLASSSYLGGNGFDSGNAVAVDAQGNVYAAGSTGSSDFPVTSTAFQKIYGGNNDGFIVKLNPASGALVYATYLGGAGNDAVNDIAIDGQGDAWVVGSTASTNFPLANPAQAVYGGSTDGFLTELDNTGAKLLFSTYYGGSGEDILTSLSILPLPQGDSVQIAAGGVTNSGNIQSARALTLSNTTSPSGDCRNPLLLILGLVHLDISSGTPGEANDDIERALNCTGTPVKVRSGPVAVPVPTLTNARSDSMAAPVPATSAVTTVPGVWMTGNLQGSSTLLAGTAPGGTSDAFVLNFAIPQVPVGAAVNATFATGTPLTPGGIAAVFGTSLAATTASAGTVPLPTTIQGTSVQLTAPSGAPKVTVQAPLFYVSPGQVSFQIPWELAGQTQASLSVFNGGTGSAPMTVSLAPAGPGIFTINAQGTGPGIILIANTATFAEPAGSIPGVDAHPAKAGDFLTIYCIGLGAVANPPTSGGASPGGPLATTLATPTVSIGGISTPAAFAGLTPGLVALYQVNAQIPAGVAPGNAVPVAITIGGATSNTVTIAVQ